VSVTVPAAAVVAVLAVVCQYNYIYLVCEVVSLLPEFYACFRFSDVMYLLADIRRCPTYL